MVDSTDATTAADPYLGLPSDVVLAEDLPETAIDDQGDEYPATSEFWFEHKSSGGLHIGSAYRPGKVGGKNHRSRSSWKSYKSELADKVKSGERTIKPRERKAATPDVIRHFSGDRGEVPYVEPAPKKSRKRSSKAAALVEEGLAENLTEAREQLADMSE